MSTYPENVKGHATVDKRKDNAFHALEADDLSLSCCHELLIVKMKLNDLSGRVNRYDERRVHCEENLAQIQADLESRIATIEAVARDMFDILNLEREKYARLIEETAKQSRAPLILETIRGELSAIVEGLIADTRKKIDSLSGTVVDLPNGEPRTPPASEIRPKTPVSSRPSARSTPSDRKPVAHSSIDRGNWFKQLRR